MTATPVITLSEYDGLAELPTVRLYAELVLDTITRGKSSKKIDATTLPMAVAAAANAQPSERASASQAPPSTATSASASWAWQRSPNCGVRSHWHGLVHGLHDVWDPVRYWIAVATRMSSSAEIR
jgi:hypothetical protein